ncbi:MAG: DUF2325 domain-containing protein [Burkholderiaceae bacterium]
MCEKHALPGLGLALPEPLSALAAPPALAWRRLKLWELGASAHCPVIGTCLPLAALRRIATRFDDTAHRLGDDYALHSQVVAQCGWRSPLTEAIQAELERRHALALRQVQGCKSDLRLQTYWEAERDGAEVGAALWACLTHARCGGLLAKRILGEVHMLAHQVGSRERTDLARLRALETQNADLRQAIAAAQTRAQQLSEAAAAAERHRSGLEIQLGGAAARSRSLEARVAELESLERKEDPRLAERAARIRQLERAIGKLQAARHAGLIVGAAAPAPPSSLSPLPVPPAALPVRLNDAAVLCVGGRPSAVPTYRKLVEGQGGRFLHHDGGTEESAARLDASLSAADLVICQTGCISHNAYWRVKDHCRRTGKRCVFVDQPSAAGLARGLRRIAVVSQE